MCRRSTFRWSEMSCGGEVSAQLRVSYGKAGDPASSFKLPGPRVFRRGSRLQFAYSKLRRIIPSTVPALHSAGHQRINKVLVVVHTFHGTATLDVIE